MQELTSLRRVCTFYTGVGVVFSAQTKVSQRNAPVHSLEGSPPTRSARNLIVALVVSLLSVTANHTFGATNVWIGNALLDFNTSANWTNAFGPPTSADAAWLMNAVTAARTVTNGALNTTIDSLLNSNSVAVAARGITLQLSNQNFTVVNTGTFGRNGFLLLKDSGVSSIIATAKFGNLVMENLIGSNNAAQPAVTVQGGNFLWVTGTGTISAGTLTIGSALNGSVIATGRVGNLVLDSGVVSTGRLNIANGNLLEVLNTGTLAGISLLTIGTGSGSGIATALFNNLTMQNSASILFGATAAAARGPDALIVTGAFVNTANNLIQGNLNGLSLAFNNSATVTNSGHITAFWASALVAQAFNISATTGNSTNTFLNSGTIFFGENGGNAGNSWTNRWTLNLDNAGSIMISNIGSAANSRNLTTYILLNGSQAVTNRAGASMQFIGTTLNAIASSSGMTDFRVDSGGFVNAGTLLSYQDGSQSLLNRSNVLTMVSGSFSNALTGQVITHALNVSNFFTIRADQNVNMGTNLLSGGTLLYQSSTTGPGILENSGWIKYDGGGLSVSVLTNKSSGVITNTQVGGGTMAWYANTTNHNFGIIDTGSGVLTNQGVIALNTGGQLVGVFSNAATGVFAVMNGTTTLNGTLLNSGRLNFDSSGRLTGGALTNLSTGIINATNGGLVVIEAVHSSGLINIGGTASVIGTTLVNNLSLSGGSVNFTAAGSDNRGPDTLIVTGSFANAANTFIQSAGNGLSLFFSNNPTVVNSGNITAIWGTALGAALNIRATTGDTTNTFKNQGTIVFGFVAPSGAPADLRTTWTNQLTMNLVNEGLLTFTNYQNAAASGIVATNLVFLNGSVAATNAATGTLAMYIHTRSGAKVTTDIRINNSFVNLGTLTALGEGSSAVTAGTNFLTVAAGHVFSNAGWVVSETNTFTGKFFFTIRADQAVNTGTNLLSGATLTYQSSTGGNGILENSGNILFDGGDLSVSILTNTASGVISNTQSGAGNTFVWRAGNTNYNSGIIATGAGMLTNLGMIVLNSGGMLSGIFSNGTGGNILLTNGTTTLTGAVLNSGNLNFSSTGTLAGGTLTNLSAGVINLLSGGNLALDLPLANSGIINALGSGVLDGPINNLSGGRINATNGTLALIGTVNNAGALNIGGTASLINTALINNLIMSGNGSNIFTAAAAGGRGPDTLIVTGQFVTTANNLISSVGGNGLSLVFQNSEVITNNGMITNFFGNTAGAGLNIRATTGNATNTLLNTGTIVFGHINGNTAGGAARTNRWDVNLVNAGFIAFTNAGSGAAGGLFTNTLLLNGTRSVTNTPTGTIALTGFQVANGARALIDLRITGGGLVNLGTLSSVITNSTNPAWTNQITIGSGTFSNAPGGQVILPSNNTGWLAIRANRSVNAGTNLITSGTLMYQTSSGGAGVLENSGTLILNGGNLVATGGITNSGVLKGNGMVVGNVIGTASGQVDPGLSIGTMTFSNNLTLAGQLNVELDGSSSGTADVIRVIGTLTLTGSTINFTQLTSVDDPSYILATYGTLVGTFGSTVGLPAGYAFDYNYNSANQIALVAIIPEPSALALVAFGLCGVFILSRHRRR